MDACMECSSLPNTANLSEFGNFSGPTLNPSQLSGIFGMRHWTHDVLFHITVRLRQFVLLPLLAQKQQIGQNLEYIWGLPYPPLDLVAQITAAEHWTNTGITVSTKMDFLARRYRWYNRWLAATLWWFTAAPKPLKYKFWGVTQPPGVADPLYSRGYN